MYEVLMQLASWSSSSPEAEAIRYCMELATDIYLIIMMPFALWWCWTDKKF